MSDALIVGKTSIIKRIKDGTFNEHVNATVGVRLFIIKKKYEKKNIMIFLCFKILYQFNIFEIVI